MSKNFPELDKDDPKRLKQLESQWESPKGIFDKFNFTARDLRLLLEHYPPLHELIQQIAGNQPLLQASHQPVKPGVEKDNAPVNTAVLEKQLADYKKTLCDYQVKNETLKQDNQALSEEKPRFIEEINALKEAEVSCQKQQKNLQQQLDDTNKPAAVITLLQGSPELAKSLELHQLPDNNTEALIKVVAVLSQQDNLKRLWERLKKNCEDERRPVNPSELELFETALQWFNYNWPNRPYQLIEVTDESHFDFNAHLRSKHTPTGETVSMYLPGLADGSGKSLCKPLVTTY